MVLLEKQAGSVQVLMTTRMKTSNKKNVFFFLPSLCVISLEHLVNYAFVVKGEKKHLCSAQGPNQCHLTPLFFCEFSNESGQRLCVCVRACACKRVNDGVRRKRVWQRVSLQQIAIGPNERGPVEPCGSTDRVYRSHKERLWKTLEPFYTNQGNMARRFWFQAV